MTTVPTSVDVTIGSAGYRTYCSSKTLDFTSVSDLDAYTASVSGDVVTFTYDGTNWIMGATEGQIAKIGSNGKFTVGDEYAQKTMTGTLLSSGWTLSNNVYTQALTFNGITSDTVGVVGLSLNITDAAREQASLVSLKLKSQGTNTLTFEATDEPTENIPVILNI